MSTQTLQRPEPVQAEPGARTMCEAFQATASRFADATALRTADGTVELTFGEYAARVRGIAAGLAQAGIGHGDTVALLMSNRPEFHLCDTATMHLGATPFSIYATSSVEQISYLLSNARSRVAIVETPFLDTILAATAGGAPRPQLVCVDSKPEGTATLEELEASGDPDFDFEAAWHAVAPQDLLTLIYTSGTTGPPKGVEITHANMLAECRALGEILPFRPGARHTSYLPSAHIADRWATHYSQMVWGIEVNSVADARQIAVALASVRPTIWGAVPRVLEKLADGDRVQSGRGRALGRGAGARVRAGEGAPRTGWGGGARRARTAPRGAR
jgi:long-chain acyl-CoA synthetase